MTDTHLSAPTRFVEVDGDRFAYRRFGNAAAGQPPLILLQHFRGGMDHWDPLMTNGLAIGREVRHPDSAGLERAPCSPDGERGHSPVNERIPVAAEYRRS